MQIILKLIYLNIIRRKSCIIVDFNMSFRIVNISSQYQNTKLTFYLPDIRDEPFEVQFIEGQYVNEIFADTLAFS